MGERWKELERTAAAALGGRRIVRQDFFETAPDVVVDDLGLVVECKAYKRHSHHRWLDKVRARYIRPGETEALVTREPGGVAYVCVPLPWLSGLLGELRAARRAGAA